MLLRPHKYQVAIISDTAQVNDGLNEDGYPIGTAEGESQPEPEWSEPVECRYVTNSKSNVKATAGGSFTVYAYVVYCDPCDNLVHRRIRLLDENGVVICDSVVDAHSPGQLNNILFIK